MCRACPHSLSELPEIRRYETVEFQIYGAGLRFGGHVNAIIRLLRYGVSVKIVVKQIDYQNALLGTRNSLFSAIGVVLGYGEIRKN